MYESIISYDYIKTNRGVPTEDETTRRTKSRNIEMLREMKRGDWKSYARFGGQFYF